jgi:hypothetical protein
MTTLEAPEARDLELLENRVQARLYGRVRHLRLDRVGDGIVLRGVARTYHAKQLAQHAVMSETDLPIHANEIEVVGPRQ